MVMLGAGLGQCGKKEMGCGDVGFWAVVMLGFGLCQFGTNLWCWANGGCKERRREGEEGRREEGREAAPASPPPVAAQWPARKEARQRGWCWGQAHRQRGWCWGQGK